MSYLLRLFAVTAVVLSGLVCPMLRADERAELASALRALDARVVPAKSEEAKALLQMLARDVRARLRAINQRETNAWREVASRADWERFRDVRIRALRASLGTVPPVPADLKVRTTRVLKGDGYQIENLVFESRPGLVVTANLYGPTTPPARMPGILLCHSHHNPKTQGELQDMGMTWARLGCLVLVMDQLGHGERGQHPFRDAKDYAGSFRPSRQDYYFRYNVSLQLYLIGDSLMGWMAWDLMRGVDLLLGRPGIDKDRIVLMGAVAGGGDPAAVTAALDPRIAAVVPFNFGGPQPETTYPLPADAEHAFNYGGSGSWESTRNLRLSARDGFLPWVIVGSVAPRRLCYAHEFAWDRERDPVWARLEKIYGFYETRDHLAFATGRGRLSGKPPESTHCNNIGAEHRKHIYPALKRWFGMPEPDKDYQQRRPSEELLCLTPEASATLKMRPLYELAGELGAQRAAEAHNRLAALAPAARQQELRTRWARLLGDVEARGPTRVTVGAVQPLGRARAERIVVETEPGVVVPMLLLLPPAAPSGRAAVVVGVSQAGKQAFLKDRAALLAGLLEGGAAICLPDVRGSGESRPDSGSRGRSSAATSISASELMLGQTLVGARLRDLRSVLKYLGQRNDLDGSRIALYGDSFAPANPASRNPAAPLDAGDLPAQAEPLGGLLALFGALFDPEVRAIYVRGGLAGYASTLRSPFFYLPHDAIVPGALTAGDLEGVAAGLAPRPLQMDSLVDGLNRLAMTEELSRFAEPVRSTYGAAKAGKALRIEAAPIPEDQLAAWFLKQLASSRD